MTGKIMGFLFFVFVSTISYAGTDLKIYHNDQYGIELKYPSDFTVIEGRDNYWKYDYTTFKPLNPKCGGSINVSYNGPKVSSYAKNQKGSSVGSLLIATADASPPPPAFLGKVKVDGLEGMHEVTNFGNGEIHIITIRKNKIKFDIGAQWGYTSDFPSQKPLPDYSNEHAVIMDAYHQIVSSLKFIKANI